MPAWSVVAGVVLGLALVIGAYLIGASRGPPRPQSPVVVKAIQELSELATIRHSMSHVFRSESDAGGQLARIFGRDRLLLVANGEVTAGIDLRELKPEDVLVAGDTIKIRLPAAKILNSKLVEESTYVVDRTTGFLIKFDKDLERQARLFALTHFVQGARSQMILPQAAQRARLLVENLLKQLGYQTVEIT